MKRTLLAAVLTFATFYALTSAVYAQTVAFPLDGGTGIGSATAGDVGNCLQVADDDPFLYQFGACSGGGGGTGVATTSLLGAYPITVTKTAASITYGVAFGTTTNNTWGGTNNFTVLPTLGTLTGLVAGNNGTLYAIATSTNFLTSLAGTAHQINASAATGNVTLSFPSHVTVTELLATNASTTNATTTGTQAIPVGASVTTPSAGNIAIDSTSGQLRYADIDGTSRVYPGFSTIAFGISTTTGAFIGTTTRYLAPAAANITVKEGWCETNTGTVNVQLKDAAGNLADDIPNASTTVNRFTFTTNNTFTKGESIRVDIGNPASSPTDVSCRFKVTYDSD